MEQFDFSLEALNKVLSSSAGRDKVGKFVHYGARGVAGVAKDLMDAAPKDSAEYVRYAYIHDKMRSLFVRLMDSRRTVRWLSSIPIVLALRNGTCPWTNRQAYVVAQCGMLFWHVIDHVRWLQQINWLPGDQARSKRISFTGFVIASFVSLVYSMSELNKVYQSEKKDKGSSNEDKKFRLRLDVIKHFSTFISVLHISELFETHEAICGAGGAITSFIDLYQLWPRAQNTKKSE